MKPNSALHLILFVSFAARAQEPNWSLHSAEPRLLSSPGRHEMISRFYDAIHSGLSEHEWPELVLAFYQTRNDECRGFCLREHSLVAPDDPFVTTIKPILNSKKNYSIILADSRAVRSSRSFAVPESVALKMRQIWQNLLKQKQIHTDEISRDMVIDYSRFHFEFKDVEVGGLSGSIPEYILKRKLNKLQELITTIQNNVSIDWKKIELVCEEVVRLAKKN